MLGVSRSLCPRIGCRCHPSARDLDVFGALEPALAGAEMGVDSCICASQWDEDGAGAGSGDGESIGE